MKSVLEIIMVAMLDSAMLIMLLNTFKRPCAEKTVFLFTFPEKREA